MEYSSFYGGRKGASFVIVKNFATIEEMATAFRNASYSSVKFDEYVLIDTANKNNPDNGKVFKRGYGYNSGKTIQWFNTQTNKVESIDAGGAQYVGRIGGSTGTTPQLVLTTYQDAFNKRSGQNWEERKNTGSYTISNEGLVPGKDGATYNDTIDWCSISMRDANAQDAIAYIGFKVPYLVDQFITSQISPYNQDGQYEDQSSVQRVDDGAHPFYHKWQINLPKGIKGESLRNLRTMIPTSTDIIYQSGTTVQYSGYEYDVANSREILVYDSYVFDNSLNPTPVTYYLGSVNGITNLSLDEHGTLTVNFSHSDPVVYQNVIKWIDEIVFNEDINGTDAPGHLLIKYNTLDSQEQQEYVEGTFDFVKNISFEEDGTVNIEYTESETQQVVNLIKWIDEITLNTTTYDTDEGTLTINYNDGNSFTAQLKWVNGLSVGANGALTLHYSGGDTQPVKDSNDNNVILKYIDSITLDTTQGGINQGKLTINYNTGASPFIENLKWVNDISIGNDGSITLKYSGGGTDKVINTTLKYVNSITLTNNGQLIANYSDNTHETLQDDVKWLNGITIQNGVLRFTYNTENDVQGEKDYVEFPFVYPTDILFNSNGQISVKYSNNETQVKTTIQSITNIAVDPNTKEIKATYNTGTVQTIGDPINTISQMAINTNDSHLLILYSDPASRGNVTYNNISGWTDLGYLFDGININSILQSFAEENILLTNGSTISLNRWYGAGYISGGTFYCSIPINKIIGLSNPAFSITNGSIQLRYNGSIVAANNLSSLNYLISGNDSGINLIIYNLNFSSTTPPDNSILGIELDELEISVSINPY